MVGRESEITNKVITEEYERELDLCRSAGGDAEALDKLGMDVYQLAEVRKGLEAGIDVSSYLDAGIPWFQMEEIRLEKEQKVDLSSYRKEGFDWAQLSQIRMGLAAGLDVSLYAKREYLAEQMREIRRGLESGVPVVFYLDGGYDWFQMTEIRKGLERQVDISVYARKDIPYMKMREIRRALQIEMTLSPEMIERYDAGIIRELRKAYEDNVSIREFVEKGYDADQLCQIRLGLTEGLDMAAYVMPEFRGDSIRELRLGLEKKIDVSVYARPEFSWQQMRELRLGLEERVDVAVYAKPLYRFTQMREIRLGLAEKLDVSYYSSLMYTAREMKKRREELEKQGYSTILKLAAQSSQFVTVSRDHLSAFLRLPEPEEGKEYRYEDVMELLRLAGVVRGVQEKAVRDLLREKRYNQSILIAIGCRPGKGEDGYYTFFFDRNVPTGPKMLEDGSVDYHSVKYFEQVKAGDKIAEYHPAGKGSKGYTVTGEEIPARDGREKAVLRGRGFSLLPDGVTYLAAVSGIIEVKDDLLEITKLYVTDEVTLATGDVYFNGSVLVRGDVGSGTIIEATEDVVVEGNVEGAKIRCGGNVLLKEGVVGGGQGYIEAAGNISGRFFESVILRAEKNIEGNYCMNCETYAGGKVSISGYKGMIVGGNTQALMGVWAQVVGNRAALRTTLDLGINRDILVAYSDLLKEASKVQGELKLLQDERKRLARRKLTTPAQFEWKSKILQAEEMKKNQFAELLDQKRKMEERLGVIKGAKAVVERAVYAGCRIVIDGTELILTGDILEARGVTFRKLDGRIAIFRN